MIFQIIWWKWLGVVIVLMVLLLGLYVPLKPGITRVEPFHVESGKDITVSVYGYNTFFTKADKLEVWIKPEDPFALKSHNVRVVNDGLLKADFTVPQQMPPKTNLMDAAVLINSDIDGAFVRPSSLVIRKGEGQDTISAVASGWTETPISDLQVLEAFRFPFRNILSESIRNTYFHIPMWFGMILIFLGAFMLSIKYLKSPIYELDEKVSSLISVGILFGVLGLATGALWAKHTWGAYWSGDIKQNMSLICLLIYAAYFVLRASMKDEERKGRVSAVYNIFAFIAMIPLLFIIPRMQDSLHPGSGGNPALGGEDLDNTMRMIFYPAIIGWTLMGVWLAELRYRSQKLERIYRDMD
jgi:heme exporter protein C